MREELLAAARDPKKLPAVVRGYELPALLTQLMKKKVSGRLTLTVGEVERTIQLMQGMISSVASKDPKEHLVQRFSRKKRLNKQQHAAVQELMQKEGLRFGAALVKLKLVDSQMFAGMLAEHHAFLLSRCLRAKAVRCVLDTQAKGPADRAPLHFLEAIEQMGVSLRVRLALGRMLKGLVLTLGKDEAALLQRMDPSPAQKRIIDACNSDGVAASALMEQAGPHSERALQALFLCGLLKPTEASLARRPTRVWGYAASWAFGVAAGAAAMFYLLRVVPTTEPAASVAEVASVREVPAAREVPTVQEAAPVLEGANAPTRAADATPVPPPPRVQPAPATKRQNGKRAR